MNKVICSIILGGLLGNSVYAKDEPKILRIGFVNQQTIFEGSNLGKTMRNKLQSDLDSKQKEFNSKQTVLQKKQEELVKNKDIMTDKEREQKEASLLKSQKDMQRLYDQIQGELEDQKQEATQKFDKIFSDAVTQVAKQEQVDLVLPENIVLYANNNLDLTSKVLVVINASK